MLTWTPISLKRRKERHLRNLSLYFPASSGHGSGIRRIHAPSQPAAQLHNQEHKYHPPISTKTRSPSNFSSTTPPAKANPAAQATTRPASMEKKSYINANMTPAGSTPTGCLYGKNKPWPFLQKRPHSPNSGQPAPS